MTSACAVSAVSWLTSSGSTFRVMSSGPSRGATAESRREEKREEREASLPRRLLAEAVGTFFLTLVAAGGEVVAVVSHGQVGTAAKVVAPGVVVMALVYSLGDVSGAHFNPAVTLAFAPSRSVSVVVCGKLLGGATRGGGDGGRRASGHLRRRRRPGSAAPIWARRRRCPWRPR